MNLTEIQAGIFRATLERRLSKAEQLTAHAAAPGQIRSPATTTEKPSVAASGGNLADDDAPGAVISKSWDALTRRLKQANGGRGYGGAKEPQLAARLGLSDGDITALQMLRAVAVQVRTGNGHLVLREDAERFRTVAESLAATMDADLKQAAPPA